MVIKLADALGTSVNVLLGEPDSEPACEETLATLAAKLAQLNEYFSQQHTKRQKRRCILWGIIGVISLFTLITNCIHLVYAHYANAELASSPAVIGGKDAATGIFLYSINPHLFLFLLAAVGFIASIVIIHLTKKEP